MKIMCLHKKENPVAQATGFSGINPGDDLLSHGLSHTTIGAAAFHFRVRDGIGWFHSANFTREAFGVSPQDVIFAGSGHGCAGFTKRRACSACLSFGLVT